MYRISYDATPVLEIGDAAEISVIIDDLNIRLLEEVDRELEVEVRCPTRFRACLQRLFLTHASTFLGETNEGVLYHVSVRE